MAAYIDTDVQRVLFFPIPIQFRGWGQAIGRRGDLLECHRTDCRTGLSSIHVGFMRYTRADMSVIIPHKYTDVLELQPEIGLSPPSLDLLFCEITAGDQEISPLFYQSSDSLRINLTR